jgi:membrane protein implicated in regulation of membrane protease activity
MGSGAAPLDQKGVRRMLLYFAVIAVAGVLSLSLNVALGLILLVVAEVFFVIAYRRFSRSRGPGPSR